MNTNHNLAITMLDIDHIEPFKNNPRKHPPRQIAMLEAGIRKYGFNNPVLVGAAESNAKGTGNPSHDLIAGHARIIAARNMGMMSVPAIILPHLSEAERRAYRIADNAIALKGEWSLDLLKAQILFQMNFDVEFDAGALGFEIGEIDALMFEAEEGDGDTQPGPDKSASAISTLSTIWSVGPHQIICGNSLDPDVWDKLMRGRKADVVISDMPFNVSVSGHISSSGNFDEFAMASSEMSESEFADMIAKAFALQAAHARDGSLSYQFIDWRSVEVMIREGRKIYDALINLCVWVKPAAGMGFLYRSQHELVCVFRNGKSGLQNARPSCDASNRQEHADDR